MKAVCSDFASVRKLAEYINVKKTRLSFEGVNGSENIEGESTH